MAKMGRTDHHYLDSLRNRGPAHRCYLNELAIKANTKKRKNYGRE
jgi:hypothetical protein